MGETGVLKRLLRRLRRRFITLLVAEQAFLAATVALCALVILLLGGTQVLDWYWPVVLLVASLGFGLWRTRGRIPTSYEVAQRVDRRLSLADALSTATWFLEVEHPRHPAVVDAQRNRAEELAATIDPVAAVPYRFPRYAYSAVALVALAGSLMVLRYGVRGALDIENPLVHIPFGAFGTADEPRAVAKAKQFPKNKMPEGLETVAIPADAQTAGEGERQPAMEAEGQEAAAQDSEGAAGKDGQPSKEGASNEEGGNDPSAANEKGQGSSAGENSSQTDAANNNAGQKSAKSPGKGDKSGSNQQQGNQSSLLDKMRDAMANMLARMKMSPQSSEGQQQAAAASQQGAQQSSAGKKEGRKGAPSPGKSQAQGEQSDESGEQKGEGASKNMNAQGKMSEGASDKQLAQEGKSGAGKQEGDKAIKDAEQAAAMGKISELLGKRAQNLTGEVLVEVSSGRQQLKTAITQRSAAHSDRGGDITRDEVPPAYQKFVQQYFEEVRKPSPGEKPKGTPDSSRQDDDRSAPEP